MAKYLNAVAAGFDNNNSPISVATRDAVAAQAISGGYEGIEFNPGEYNFTEGPGWTIAAFLSLVCPRPNGALLNISGELLMNARDRTVMPERRRTVQGLTLNCVEAANNTYGLRVRLPTTGAFVDRALFTDFQAKGFGKQGLCLDNTIENVDGFFTSDVDRCIIENGIKWINTGDSMRLTRNVLHGTKATRTEISGIRINGTPAARMNVIRNNSFTTQGGMLLLQHASGYNIENNWFEHPGYQGDMLGPAIGSIEMGDCWNVNLKNDNSISCGNNTPYNVVLYGTTRVVRIRLGNEYLNRGTLAHIYATPSTDDIVVHQTEEKFPYGAPYIVLQGTNSRIVT